jgi:hypothetical protein
MTSELTVEQQAELKPCPFCGDDLYITRGVNPSARCETVGCWMHERMIGITVEDPRQVEQWNTRITTEAELARLREENDSLRARGAAAVIAYHVAICSPKGVVPDDSLYDQDIAASVERRLHAARTALGSAR